MISIVCPFYNEDSILENSVLLMLSNLVKLQEEWELIIVDDGSEDNSLETARALEKEHGNLKVISYPSNRGRGYAIRTGVAQSRGDIIVTTEIDSSWGDDIVYDIVEKFKEKPDADIVIASPHLSPGGYKNVPLKRVFLSKYGNLLIRMALSKNVTMNTGMTRGYRREKFLALPLEEDEKEMHLEIVNKAIALNYKIYEVPATLEWKVQKLRKDPAKKRTSSSRINKLIRTHLLFSIAVAPFRYIFPVSLFLGFLSLITFILALYNLFTPQPSIYWLITSFFLGLFGFLIFGIGLLAQQNRAIMRELWILRSKKI
ncbi:glycosyltransferase family 2 protein [bacterium]|nr:glycosyltransferase family 2 protein [bacterium]